VNAPVIAPSNGSEHVWQNGATMRMVFDSQ